MRSVVALYLSFDTVSVLISQWLSQKYGITTIIVCDLVYGRWLLHDLVYHRAKQLSIVGALCIASSDCCVACTIVRLSLLCGCTPLYLYTHVMCKICSSDLAVSENQLIDCDGGSIRQHVVLSESRLLTMTLTAFCSAAY